MPRGIEKTTKALKQRLCEQEAWGKWNTAPLANCIYGKPTWLSRVIDCLIFIATYAFIGYQIWSFIQ